MRVSRKRVVVANLDAGVHRVLVCPEEPQATKMKTESWLEGWATQVYVNQLIPFYTPKRGTIRVEDNLGVFRRLEYVDWSDCTFFLANEYEITAARGNRVFVSYIDKLAENDQEWFWFEAGDDLPQSVFVRVRSTPYRGFEARALITDSNDSYVYVINTPDQ